MFFLTSNLNSQIFLLHSSTAGLDRNERKRKWKSNKKVTKWDEKDKSNKNGIAYLLYKRNFRVRLELGI